MQSHIRTEGRPGEKQDHFWNAPGSLFNPAIHSVSSSISLGSWGSVGRRGCVSVVLTLNVTYISVPLTTEVLRVLRLQDHYWNAPGSLYSPPIHSVSSSISLGSWGSVGRRGCVSVVLTLNVTYISVPLTTVVLRVLRLQDHYWNAPGSLYNPPSTRSSFIVCSILLLQISYATVVLL